VSLLILIPVFTFYFLWRFNDFMAALRDHLPDMYRDGIVHLVGTIDAAIANFFRGRLIVCLVVGGVASLGWSLVGVPYSLPLGVLTGLLNLVPFVSLLALPPALLFAFLGASEVGAPWLWPVVLTMGVYMGVQALEAFVLSPAILGHTVGLHPLAIVVALLIGAEVAGLLGLLLAVPVASTLKTLAAEFLLPEVRRLAGWPAAPSRPPGPPAGAPRDTGAEQSQG
jgi:predicted PurR-regulated permease PerM